MKFLIFKSRGTGSENTPYAGWNGVSVGDSKVQITTLLLDRGTELVQYKREILNAQSLDQNGNRVLAAVLLGVWRSWGWWQSSADEIADEFVEVFGLINEQSVCSVFKNFDAYIGLRGLDELRVGFEIRLADIEDGFFSFFQNG